MEIKHFAEFQYKNIIPLVDKSVEVDSSNIYEIIIPDENVDAIILFDRAFEEIEINGEKQILKSGRFNVQRFLIEKEGISTSDIIRFFPIHSVKDTFSILPQDELTFDSTNEDFSK